LDRGGEEKEFKEEKNQRLGKNVSIVTLLFSKLDGKI